MNANFDAFDRPVSPTIRWSGWLLIVLFAIIVSGSYLAKTEIVARGQGKVVPTSRLQVVQPQAAGKVAEILVKEGQAVKAGDILIRMETMTAESTIQRIESEIERQTLEATVARSMLEPLARLDPSDENFIAAGLAILQDQTRSPAQLKGADALVISILTALRDEIGETDAQLTRIARARDAQQARLDKARSDKEIVAKRFTSAAPLRERGTISESDYLERLRGLKATEGEVLVAARELDTLAAETETTLKQRTRLVSETVATYRKQLNAAEIALQSLQAERRAARNQLTNLSLKAPVSGRVENLQVFTIGSFVEAGLTLMSIVPSDHEIEIEALFDNRDIGFLQPEQQTLVKFDAFPAERFGIVYGRITSIGADARQDQTGSAKWLYAIRVKLDHTFIRIGSRQFEFASGMTATIDVITGERRLISYFFEPILKIFQDGFGER